jgi:cysteine synthase
VPIRIDLSDEKKPKPVADAENGVRYFVAGCGPAGTCCDVSQHALHAFQKKIANFLVFTVEGDTAKGRGIALPSQEAMDTFEITSRR